ncbi:septation protein A [Desertibaculum subflavum]|uniref:septation protein A n=1 Tax=Desertibaculum subflavum TaxID=2268458 RepID=UPI000E67309A
MTRRPPHPLVKLAIETGPLLVFFVTNARFGIFAATGAFMVAIVAALAASYAIERKLPTLPLVTAFFVLVFGGLTLMLQDELFIKLKPTIVNTLFAAILAGGMLFDRPLLKPLMGAVLPLDDQGWRILTWRWAGFFLLLAVLNEVVWRTQTTDTWVSFKVFGVMPLTIVFMLAQVPLLRRHGSDADA